MTATVILVIGVTADGAAASPRPDSLVTRHQSSLHGQASGPLQAPVFKGQRARLEVNAHAEVGKPTRLAGHVEEFVSPTSRDLGGPPRSRTPVSVTVRLWCR